MTHTTSNQPTNNKLDVIILGAGAAGLLCAIEAGRRNRRVLLIDHADKAGKKILISGGGRCNFTNLHTRPENFLSDNPHFAKSALSRYTPADIIALVEQHNIPYHEKTLGQLFCDRSAQDILTMLERECAQAKVEVLLGTKIISVTQPTTSTQQPTTRFTVETTAGTFHSTLRRDRHRRPIHPQDGRHRLRLRHRPPIQHQHHPHPPRTRPASLQPHRYRPTGAT